MTERRRNALIVGASRGLGFGLVETLLGLGWRVTATQRKASPQLAALASEALTVETADIDDDDAVCALRERLDAQSFDLVFVVAGVATAIADPVHEVPREVAAQVYLTNAVSPVRFAETFVDRVATGGTIAFMSSILGSVALNESGGSETYRASKAALNTYARSFEARHRGRPFGVLLIHPGWVRTDMGGADADIDIATSVAGMAEVIEGQIGKTGIAYLDYEGQPLAW
ncbi:SDR family oxidoreductase [Methylobacterium brachythecii]|uniref:NAD(P)-dependent dehydrogenase (Short-subunit alcohol dehydrogenase family) n=1 Tax=Methylobacterium brachythecii TaxID=1176177 RepID=A0A7W6AJP9_9HYPH|nr:SDR family oxidoreductase [Methylobacterium brachythecii]MBB3902580.1 NAD(P)-dependent dehydrogenase (short-subunit alcohol dehydrogenase family) [Methylobacterium brachythecii]GLS42425.1 short-chain dehydrogenase [Methylobacterium brachythecii]